MSARATFWAWEVHGLTSMQRLVLLKLADNHNDDTKRCNPSIDYISTKTGQNPKTVRSALQDLEKMGLLEIQPRSGRSTNYFLNVGRMLHVVEQSNLFGPPTTEVKVKKSKEKPIKYNERHITVAAWMAAGVKVRHPTQEIDPYTWADTVRKLEHIDGYPLQTLVDTWAWIINHDGDRFSWADNCRTPMKLRQKKEGLTYYQIIRNQMGREEFKHGLNQSGYKESIAEFAARESETVLSRRTHRNAG